MKAHPTVALSRRSAGSIPRGLFDFLKLGHSADAQFEKRNRELGLAYIGAPLTISPPATTTRSNRGVGLSPHGTYRLADVFNGFDNHFGGYL